jgi:hypothetical protein
LRNPSTPKFAAVGSADDGSETVAADEEDCSDVTPTPPRSPTPQPPARRLPGDSPTPRTGQPQHIVAFARWATRQNYEDYLAWRTETGMTDEIDALLTEPLIIKYFDDLVSITSS